jgi:hypothetical protein
MRYLRIVLTLVFGLALVGPETHACPVHTAAPAARHHQDNHQPAKGKGHCTCPQACCPTGVSASLPAPAANWTAAPLPVVAIDRAATPPLLIPARNRLLPFALAPPLPPSTPRA